MPGEGENSDRPAPTPSTSAAFHELYEPIGADLAASSRIFDRELSSEIDEVNELCRYVSCYRGKMLRPALLLLSAKASGELRPAHPVLAAVVEMVHVATLIHDDVLDDADQRRRQPTIRALSGNAAAVLLGDCLISHAFHLCSSLQDQHASRRIAATTNVVCECELLQNLRSGNLDLSEADYLRIIKGKTGALTAVACELGAHYAGASPTVVAAMHDFGMSVGVAFQIVDDLLDLVGTEGTTGKTLGRDLALGKLTLPIIYALRGDDGVARGLRSICSSRLASSNEIVGLLKQAGGLEYALSVARRHVREAVGRLDLLPAGAPRRSLATLAEFIPQRQA